jgi:hypothetical protein
VRIMFTLGLLLLLLASGTLQAAPMTLKELEFLLRQETPETEILKEARERRLVAPITEVVAAALKEAGASDGLVKNLNAPGIVLSVEESQAEAQRRQAALNRTRQAVEEDRAVLEARQQRDAAAIAQKEKAETMRRALQENLVQLDDDQIRPFNPKSLSQVRVFALYYSSLASMESRRYTPKMIEAYKRLKQKYPTQFELVWVSCDRDEFNMGLHMRTMRMPWPAARFGKGNDTFTKFAGNDLPWLVAIADTGEPLTQNAVTKKSIEPDKVIEGIEYLLSQLK